MKEDQAVSKNAGSAGKLSAQNADASWAQDADASWSIGADASLQEVVDSPGCPPLLRQTLSGALSWQTRNRRQVGRALASPSIAPQWSAALLALGATVTVEGEAGSFETPVEALLQQRAQGQITALHVKTKCVRWGEAHVGRTPADEPIVAAIAGVQLNEGVVRQARIALTGVSPKPVLLTKAAARLVGTSLGAEDIRAVAETVEEEVAPKGDFLGTEEYRRAMAGVLTRRALEQCLDEEAKNE